MRQDTPHSEVLCSVSYSLRRPYFPAIKYAPHVIPAKHAHSIRGVSIQTPILEAHSDAIGKHITLDLSLYVISTGTKMILSTRITAATARMAFWLSASVLRQNAIYDKNCRVRLVSGQTFYWEADQEMS